ncbi:glycosyltransferase family 4 protein [Algoriphagus sp. AGSA1]|uniref:glycosyltransferase family 4 protein n=1 Tax=Algoriphagus sp. AGSA1 TaxID=2907213 RepID=UPI001F412F03|nr:glycosyltransferase family 1 protein [Algoriphagus sp. AGSA1]MCE7058237.1 glycosyltransferase family 4 protein [Algoriphagus sp. AGSA1]
MRVAFDYQIFCLQAYGGISRYITRLADHLYLLEQQVKIFAPLHCNEYLAQISPSLRQGCRISARTHKAMRLTIPYNHLVGHYQQRKWRPDVVHETYFSAFNTKPKAPTCLTVYDMVHERFPDSFSRLNTLSTHKAHAIKRADHIICISHSTRNDLLAHIDITPEKVSVVHLGFEPFSQITFPAPKEITNRSRPYLLFVGNRSGYKNFSGLLRAVSISRRLKAEFDIIAVGGGALTSKEEALIASMGYEARQIRQVTSSDADLGKLYQGAAALVYPSFYEGFGLPPLEAMAQGCPVVVSNRSAIPEVVGEAGSYFDPTSAEDMSSAIEKVVFSPEMANQFIAKGYQRLKHFSWEKCAQKTLDIYQNLAH